MAMPVTAVEDLEEEERETPFLDLLNLGHLWDIKTHRGGACWGVHLAGRAE